MLQWHVGAEVSTSCGKQRPWPEPPLSAAGTVETLTRWAPAREQLRRCLMTKSPKAKQSSSEHNTHWKRMFSVQTLSWPHTSVPSACEFCYQVESSPVFSLWPLYSTGNALLPRDLEQKCISVSIKTCVTIDSVWVCLAPNLSPLAKIISTIMNEL